MEIADGILGKLFSGRFLVFHLRQAADVMALEQRGATMIGSGRECCFARRKGSHPGSSVCLRKYHKRLPVLVSELWNAALSGPSWHHAIKLRFFHFATVDQDALNGL